MEFKDHIDRLRHEGLFPPKTTYYTTGSRPKASSQQQNDSSWIVVGDQDNKSKSNVVLDAVEYVVESLDDDRNPDAWKKLFSEAILSPSGISHDDLLFFVQPDQAYPTQDQVLLRRKTGQDLPKLDVIVDWKSTFWLNLVTQLPCRLSVSVCERVVGDAEGGKKKTSMQALKRVSRKVYATPFKSNMQVKEMSHELSFPLVYYTINNFEDADLHLAIGPNEWLCVELAAIFTHGKDEDSWYDLPGGSPNMLNDVQLPFPNPKNAAKTILFQGAVAYSALREVYDAKKSTQAALQLQGGRRNVIAQTLTSFFRPSPPPTKEQRHEFLMMRGPKGRGQCQVRVSEKGGELGASLTFLNLPFGAVACNLYE